GRLITRRPRDPAPGPSISHEETRLLDPDEAGPGDAWEESSAPEQVIAGAALPARIGVYEVREELARGGMGVVLRAYHPKLDLEVALKVLLPEAEADPEAEARFLLEARAAAR